MSEQKAGRGEGGAGGFEFDPAFHERVLSALTDCRAQILRMWGGEGSPFYWQWLEPTISRADQIPAALEDGIETMEEARMKLASDLSKAQAAKDEARENRDQMQRKLERFGGHHPDCYWLDSEDPSKGCNCGWKQLVEAWSLDVVLRDPPLEPDDG